mgnify:CR=1 FL=1
MLQIFHVRNSYPVDSGLIKEENKETDINYLLEKKVIIAKYLKWK